MLTGVTVFAYITGTVSSLLTSFNAQSKRLTEHQYQLDAFCRSHSIPKPLGEKMMQFYAYVMPRKVHADDQAIISGLSGSLRCQVCLPSSVYRDVSACMILLLASIIHPFSFVPYSLRRST